MPLEGRLFLVNYVLQSIPFFGFSLFIIQESTVYKIRKKIFQFLWVGKLEYSKFHLTSWESLSKSKLMVGWGIKNLNWFNRALCAKSLWRSLFDEGLWGKIVKSKILKCVAMVHWFRDAIKGMWTLPKEFSMGYYHGKQCLLWH